VAGNGARFLDAALREDAREYPVGLPEAGVWYTLDAAWALPAGDQAHTVRMTLALSSMGLEIDEAFRAPRHHLLAIGGRAPVEMGWCRSAEVVYLSAWEAALGFFRVRFRESGAFTWVLPGLAPRTYIVGTPSPALTPPQLSRLSGSPLAPHPAVVVSLSFSGTYPAGGLDFGPTIHGVGVPRFIDVADTPQFRFVPDIPGQKLRVFNAGSAEASGSISFSTQALIFGEVL